MNTYNVQFRLVNAPLYPPNGIMALYKFRIIIIIIIIRTKLIANVNNLI